MYPKEVADATFSVGLTWVHRHLLTALDEKLGSRFFYV